MFALRVECLDSVWRINFLLPPTFWHLLPKHLVKCTKRNENSSISFGKHSQKVTFSLRTFSFAYTFRINRYFYYALIFIWNHHYHSYYYNNPSKQFFILSDIELLYWDYWNGRLVPHNVIILCCLIWTPRHSRALAGMLEYLSFP